MKAETRRFCLCLECGHHGPARQDQCRCGADRRNFASEVVEEAVPSRPYSMT